MTNGLIEHTELPDGDDRVITFSGQLLAHASSRKHSQPRWTEISIFRTDDDPAKYIIHKVGATAVQHAPGCKRTRRSGWMPQGEYDPKRVPCRDCNPLPHTQVAYERPHFSTQIAATAQGCIAALYSIDPRGLHYLTFVCEDAARLAAERDRLLAEAFHTFDASSLSERGRIR